MEPPGRDLDRHGHDEDRREHSGRGEVAEVHRHRQCVARGLAQRSGEDLEHPEQQGDGRNLDRGRIGCGDHAADYSPYAITQKFCQRNLLS